MVECVDTVGTQETGGCCLHDVTHAHFGPLYVFLCNSIPCKVGNGGKGEPDITMGHDSGSHLFTIRRHSDHCKLLKY